jgi:hypothetical protein
VVLGAALPHGQPGILSVEELRRRRLIHLGLLSKRDRETDRETDRDGEGRRQTESIVEPAPDNERRGGLEENSNQEPALSDSMAADPEGLTGAPVGQKETERHGETQRETESAAVSARAALEQEAQLRAACIKSMWQRSL